jgi:hypothetical protein
MEDWITVVRNCSYSWQNVCDPNLIKRKITDRKSPNIIIYNKNKSPAAIFSGSLESRKLLFLKFTSLNCRFEGLFIRKNHLQKATAIKKYVFVDVFRNYYVKQLKVDRVFYTPPPNIPIYSPHKLILQSPIKNYFINYNSILITDLRIDVLKSLKFNVRYEIKKGQEAIKDFRIVEEKSEIDIASIMSLDNEKSLHLGIKANGREYFIALRDNDHSHFYLLMDNQNNLLSVVITRQFQKISTFHYNASVKSAKDGFYNKALLCSIFQKEKEQGSEFFILGDGMDNNIKNVTFFKRSLSNLEIPNPQFSTYLSIRGMLFTLFRKLNNC